MPGMANILWFTYSNTNLMPRCRDANFQDVEIVRSEERGSLGRRQGPSGGAGEAPFGGPGEYVTVYLILSRSDIQKILQKIINYNILSY